MWWWIFAGIGAFVGLVFGVASIWFIRGNAPIEEQLEDDAWRLAIRKYEPH